MVFSCYTRPIPPLENLPMSAVREYYNIFAATLHLKDPRQRSRYSHWLRAGRPRGRSWSPGGVKNFLFFTSFRPALGSTQPPIYPWVPGALPPGLKRPGRETYHSPPASAEVKKMWIYTSTPPYAFMA
jgi:hypothetical protein